MSRAILTAAALAVVVVACAALAVSAPGPQQKLPLYDGTNAVLKTNEWPVVCTPLRPPNASGSAGGDSDNGGDKPPFARPPICYFNHSKGGFFFVCFPHNSTVVMFHCADPRCHQECKPVEVFHHAAGGNQQPNNNNSNTNIIAQQAQAPHAAIRSDDTATEQTDAPRPAHIDDGKAVFTGKLFAFKRGFVTRVNFDARAASNASVPPCAPERVMTVEHVPESSTVCLPRSGGAGPAQGDEDASERESRSAFVQIDANGDVYTSTYSDAACSIALAQHTFENASCVLHNHSAFVAELFPDADMNLTTAILARPLEKPLGAGAASAAIVAFVAALLSVVLGF